MQLAARRQRCCSTPTASSSAAARSIDVGIDRLAAASARDGTSAETLCERIVGRLERRLADDVAILAARAHADRRARCCTRCCPRSRPARGAAPPARPPGSPPAARTREERNDIVLAIHEAAMNAVEHAYGPGDAELVVTAALRDGVVEVEVRDSGRWRESRRRPRARRGR